MNAHVDPAQLAPADTLLPPMEEWICEGPIKQLQSELDAMNAAVKATIGTNIKDPEGNFRWRYRNFVDRSLIFHLDQREYTVLMAIITRTAPFATFADTIPLSQFKDGLRDAQGNLVIDKKTGMPYFEGTNLNYGTIRSATASLAKKGLISIYSIPKKGMKDVHAYSFVSLRTMYAAVFEFDIDHSNTMLELIKDDELREISIFRKSASELEHRCVSMFKDGFKNIMHIRKERAAYIEKQYRESVGSHRASTVPKIGTGAVEK